MKIHLYCIYTCWQRKLSYLVPPTTFVFFEIPTLHFWVCKHSLDVIYHFRDDAESLLLILNAPPFQLDQVTAAVCEGKKTKKKPSMRSLLCSVEGYFWSGARAWMHSALTIIALFVPAAFSGVVQQGFLGKTKKEMQNFTSGVEFEWW